MWVPNFLRRLRPVKTISVEQLPELFHGCFVNASNLHTEASLLFKEGKFARAYYLAAVGLEELAKPPFMLNAQYFSERDYFAWKALWADFYSHSSKQGIIRNYGQTIMRTLAKSKSDSFARELPKQKKFDKRKLRSLYTDFTKGRVTTPHAEFATDAEAREILQSLKERLEGFADIYSSLKDAQRFVQRCVATEVTVDGKPFRERVRKLYTKRGRKMRD